MNVAQILDEFQPASSDIAGFRVYWNAVAAFMFDGSEMPGLPRHVRRALKREARSFNVHRGPRVQLG